jgi:hypothetical protein
LHLVWREAPTEYVPMSRNREYLFMCRGCKHTRRVAEQDVSASLMVLLCDECGDERQPVLRAVPQERAVLAMPLHAGSMSLPC